MLLSEVDGVHIVQVKKCAIMNNVNSVLIEVSPAMIKHNIGALKINKIRGRFLNNVMKNFSSIVINVIINLIRI